MTYSEFSKIRRSSRYKVGDKVWFERIVSFSNTGARTAIEMGTVEYLPDDYSCFYGIRPCSTDEDTFCIIDTLPRDMRKVRK